MRKTIIIMALGLTLAACGSNYRWNDMGYGPGSPLVDVGGADGGSGGTGSGAGEADSTGAPL